MLILSSPRGQTDKNYIENTIFFAIIRECVSGK